VEIAVVIAVMGISVLLLGRLMLGKFGIGRHEGKPDCGCGDCKTKGKQGKT
jgi:hypothetical protein